MDTIKVTLLNSPSIQLNGQQITFPLKKADALFFYMVVQKNVTRTELSNLLWGGQSETASRKNLRNALYVIKKAFGFDPFESPKQQILKLNHVVTFEVDYDHFMESRDISLYNEDFLHGFSLKDSYEYDEWMNAVRSHTLDIYLHQLLKEFQQTPSSHVTQREHLFHRYIQADALDERIYMSMMETYLHENLYLKGIKCYENLAAVLKSEMSMVPSPELNQLYRTILQQWKDANQTRNQPNENARHALLSGRRKELQLLNHSYQQLQLRHASTIFILGEKGVGKSYLCQSFLDSISQDHCLTLNAICYEQDRSTALTLWNHLLLQLRKKCQEQNIPIPMTILDSLHTIFPMLESLMNTEDIPQDVTASYNYRAVRNSVLRMMNLVSEKLPLLIYIDNIQNMDDMSLEWLSSLIRSENENIMILCTCSLYPPLTIERFINNMVCRRNVSKVTLNRFTQEDLITYIQTRGLEHLTTSADIDRIYNECKGNPFYMRLILDHLENSSSSNAAHARAMDILAAQFSVLDIEEQRLLELISLFPDFATLELLQHITGNDPMHILELTDHLKHQEMIEEVTGHRQVSFHFLHSQMQEYVRRQMSPSKARLYHKRIADYLEHLPARIRPQVYHHLIEHFSQSGNQPKALYYRIRRMEAYAMLNYELYPVLNKNVSISPSLEEIFKHLHSLEAELEECYTNEPDAINYSEAEARLFLTIGRTCIQQGMYDKGLPYIQNPLKNNEFVADHSKIRQSFLRQIIFYAIQTWKTDIMEDALTECFRIDEQRQDSCQEAIDLRLEGVLYSMQGEIEKSNERLELAIETFRSTPLALQTYSVNLAACYRYLSRNFWLQGNTQCALRQIKKAIQLCNDKKVPINPTFYVCQASCYMTMKNYELAAQSIDLAWTLYENSPAVMARFDCCFLSSILSYMKGNKEEAVSYLIQGRNTAMTVGYLPGIYAYLRLQDHYHAIGDEDLVKLLPEVTEDEEHMPDSMAEIWKKPWDQLFR